MRFFPSYDGKFDFYSAFDVEYFERDNRLSFGLNESNDLPDFFSIQEKFSRVNRLIVSLFPFCRRVGCDRNILKEQFTASWNNEPTPKAYLSDFT